MAKKKTAKKKTAKKVAKKNTAKKKTAKKVAKKKTDQKIENKTSEKKEVKKAVESVETKVTQETAPKTKSKQSQEMKEVEKKVQKEIGNLQKEFSWDEIQEAIISMDFFIDEKSDECLDGECDNLRTTGLYCRLHYIANWNRIKRTQEILAKGKLQDFILELLEKYPANQIESIISDLSDDKQFYKVLNELNIATDVDFEEDVDFDTDGDDDDDIALETGKFSTGVTTVSFDEES